ncbi:MAG: hypothetical protein K9J72_07975 [Synechococcus sp. Tobar2m-G35]|jgi:hypothetical protein|nr:hypothetical protein [Synechococcus sp. Tobar2m-G35]
MGFTLVELLVAAAIGLLTATVAGETLLGHLRSSERAEALERQRSDWSRTSGFLEAELALSERAIGTEANIGIPAACAVGSGEFRLALDLRRDLPPVIYFVRPSDPGWLGANTLWRCGPTINDDGTYRAALVRSPLLDGLDGGAESGGFLATPEPDGEMVSFKLTLRGQASRSFSQPDRGHTRISPLYSRPSDLDLCGAANMVKLAGTASADDLTMQIGQVNLGEDVLICGFGGGDTIRGSQANDILECGRNGTADTSACFLWGKAGNDVLRGGPGADSLDGDTRTSTDLGSDGNDVLTGGSGNDTLSGGDGQNSYLPGAGNDRVIGGSGLDIVFLNGNRADTTIVTCSKASCSVSSASEGTDTLSGVEILIFRDARYDIPD